MRVITAVLVVLLGLVHAELWFGNKGVPTVMNLQAQLQAQYQANAQARQRNRQIMVEVSDLKEGLEMVEEKARGELGMLRSDEILVQVAAQR